MVKSQKLNCQLSFAKNYTFNNCEGSNYAPLAVSFSCTVYNAAHEDTVVYKNSVLKDFACVAGPETCNKKDTNISIFL